MVLAFLGEARPPHGYNGENGQRFIHTAWNMEQSSVKDYAFNDQQDSPSILALLLCCCRVSSSVSSTIYYDFPTTGMLVVQVWFPPVWGAGIVVFIVGDDASTHPYIMCMKANQKYWKMHTIHINSSIIIHSKLLVQTKSRITAEWK